MSLLVAPWTVEDTHAWVVGCSGRDVRRYMWLLLHSVECDRADAHLMRHLSSSYRDITGWQRSYPGVWHAACAFQGIAIPRDLS